MSPYLPHVRGFSAFVLSVWVLLACHDEPTDTTAEPDGPRAAAAALVAKPPVPVTGDFDGEGHTDIALYDTARARGLLDATVDGHFDGITPQLGLSSDIPFMGDWNDDGVETLALYRRSSNQVIYCNTSNKDGQFQVRNVVTVTGSGIPIKGDWNGDGRDGFAIYDVGARKFTFYQSMGAASSFATHTVGNPGDKPISGNWDNTGGDGYGLYRPADRTFYYINTIGGTPSAPTNSVGNPGDLPIFGKWHGHNNWSVGLYRDSTKQFFLFDDTNVGTYQLVTWTDVTTVEPTSGRQLFYTNGAPHTNGASAIRTVFDSTISFLPIAIYGIASTTTESNGNMFQQIKQANFTAATIYPTLDTASALNAVGSTGIKLMFRSDFFPSPLDGNSKVMGWYSTFDEPDNQAELNGLRAEYTRVAAANRPVWHVNLSPNFSGSGCPLGLQDMNLWTMVAAEGDLAVMDCYPVLEVSRDTISSFESFAASVTKLRTASPTNRPLWLVLEGLNQNYPGTDPWALPTPAQFRSMAYASFVHGATGIIDFIRDGTVSRQVGVVGISPEPVTVPSNCDPNDPIGYPKCTTAAPGPIKTRSQTLWNSIVGLNAEFKTLKPALLSPTKNDAYTVDVQQSSNSASSPIRTLLKSSPAGTYLIAVNITKQDFDAVIQLTSSPTSANVLFESRSITMPLSAVRDHFAPFATHVYKY